MKTIRATEIHGKDARDRVSASVVEALPLWQLDIAEVTGHNLEARGREEVNRLLQTGWRLLHIDTLRYQEDGIWRERPMAILGRSRSNREEETLKTSASPPANVKARVGRTRKEATEESGLRFFPGEQT